MAATLTRIAPTGGRGNAQFCAPPTQGEAAELLNVSRRAVQNAAKVQRTGTPELNRAVADGRVSVDDAARVAAETPEVQNEAVESVLAGRARTVAEAAALCDRCRREGAVDDCPRCKETREAKPGRSKTPPKWTEPSELQDLKASTTGLARKFTEVISGEGEVNKRLLRYSSAAGLVDHTPATIEGDEVREGKVRFLPLAGVRALLELAEAPGPVRSDAEVRRIYDEASGGWIPPLTRRRRRDNEARRQAKGGLA
jgi:hypothetical protein